MFEVSLGLEGDETAFRIVEPITQGVQAKLSD